MLWMQFWIKVSGVHPGEGKKADVIILHALGSWDLLGIRVVGGVRKLDL